METLVRPNFHGAVNGNYPPLDKNTKLLKYFGVHIFTGEVFQ